MPARRSRLVCRVHAFEKKLLVEASRRSGLTLSSYVRRAALLPSQRALRDLIGHCLSTLRNRSDRSPVACESIALLERLDVLLPNLDLDE